MKKETQLSNQIKKLQYQLSYSQHINKELGSQLARLCDKLGLSPTKYRQSSSVNAINPQTHLQQLYYVQPLLMCYEQTLHLLKSELQQAKQQAKGILSNTQEIINENNFVRRQLESKIQLLSKTDNLGLNVNFLNLQNKDLKDKISILNAKNQFLIRKNKQINQEVQKIKKLNIQLFDQSQIDKLQYRSKEDSKMKQTEIINYKNKIQQLKNQLNNQKIISADFDKQINKIDNENIKLKNQLKIVKQQLQNNQTIQERVKQNLDTEIMTLKDQLSISQRKQQQLFTKCMALESQLQDKGNKIHNINVQNTQLQSNNNNMLQMLESYEVKVSTLNKKIKQLENDVKEMNEQKSQCTKRAQVSQWKLSQKNQQIERRETQWKKQKLRITKMWQDRLEAQRKNYDIQQPFGITSNQ